MVYVRSTAGKIEMLGKRDRRRAAVGAAHTCINQALCDRSQILCDRREFFKGGFPFRSRRFERLFDAMDNVVVNESLLGVHDRIFNRLQLLRELETGALVPNHDDDGPKVPLGPLKPFHNIGVACVTHRLGPVLSDYSLILPAGWYILPGGWYSFA
jgi:hypothetical protein